MSFKTVVFIISVRWLRLRGMYENPTAKAMGLNDFESPIRLRSGLKAISGQALAIVFLILGPGSGAGMTRLGPGSSPG